MGVDEAVLRCLTRYVGFSGRAGPAEFWWFALFYVVALLLTLALLVLSSLAVGPALAFLATLTPPLLAVTVRRMHDIGMAGSALLLMVPVVGQVLLLVWLVRPGVSRRNRFGFEPEKERASHLLIAR